MEENKTYTLKIEKLDDDLHGVAFRGGKKYVVNGALAGEVVEAEERIVSGNAVVCRLLKVVHPSPDRISPPCKYGGECGGCALTNVAYDTQLKYKTSLVRRKLSPFDGIAVENCVGFGVENMRNKAHIAFSEKGGRIFAGFFNEETHRVEDIPFCLCHGEWYSFLRKSIIEWIKKCKISLYNPRTGIGLLRFAAARVYENSLMLTLVCANGDKFDYAPLYDALKKKFSSVALFINVNGEKTNEVLHGEVQHALGAENLAGECLGIKFSLTPTAFFQTNYKVTEEIYKKSVEIIAASGAKKVVDLFSGIGVTSALFAKKGFSVDAVEINKAAVQSALRLAVQNGVADKVRVRCGDCKKVFSEIDAKDAAVFIDPPRAGIGAETAVAIASSSPATVVYLSCNLKTLVSDLAVFADKGYIPTAAFPYDMFPSTNHLETLVCLTKKS